MDNTLFLISTYLRKQNLPVEFHVLSARILSDPGNNVVTITNTLDYLNIDHVVATVPKTILKELPDTFLAILTNGEHNALVMAEVTDKDINITLNSNKQFGMSKEHFLKEWTGFIIAIDQNTTSWFQQYKNKLSTYSIALTLSSLSILYTTYQTKSLWVVLSLLTSMVGLGISYLTFAKKHSNSTIADSVCNISANTECDGVLNSKQSNLFFKLDLSDAAVIYFVFITLSFTFKPDHSLFIIISTGSLVAIPYSLYTQYFVIKKWCPLCLGIATAMVLLFLAQLQVYDLFSFEMSPLPIYIFFFIVTVISWLHIKRYLLLKTEHHQVNIENLTFRRNHDMFLAYYQSLSKISGTEKKFISIKKGNESALISIIAITNPLCKACLQTHKVYEKILRSHPDQIKIEYLFLVPLNNPNDPKILVSAQLLQIYSERTKTIFDEAWHEWFDLRDSTKWFNKWGKPDNHRYKNALIDHSKWCLQNNIDSTPLIILNGKIFPASYKSEDLESLIEPILQFESELKVRQKDIMHDKTETLDVLK